MRKILHIDMDAFFASVEQRDNPELRGKPVIVGGRPESRGVVAACSYEARQFGVHSAMPSSRAIKLCKQAIFVPPRFDVYRQASKEIHAVFREFTKDIEPLSLDEAYLDVTEIAKYSGSATEVAMLIKKLIKQRTNLIASAGVSYNKFLAKIASDMDKPDGLSVIRPEQALAFIESLEIRKFFGIGKVTEQKMHALGIYNGADLKKLSKSDLHKNFGRSGEYYYNVARGIDNRPVSSSRVRKSIGSETTFNSIVIDKGGIWSKLQSIAQGLEESLIKKNVRSRTVTLKVKYADFELVTRSKTVEQSLQTKDEMLAILPELLRKTEVGDRAIRLIGITLAKLDSHDNTTSKIAVINKKESPQLDLF